MKNLLFILISCLIACCKTIEPENPTVITEPKPIDTTNISSPRVIWRTNIHPDSTLGAVSVTPIKVFGDDIVMTDNYVKNNEDKAAVRSINIKNAKLNWVWENFRLDFIHTQYIYNNIGAFTTGSDVEVLNLNTGKKMWGLSKPGDGGPRLTGYKDDLYYMLTTEGSAPKITVCDLIKTPLQNQDWKIIHRQKQEKHVYAFLEMPSFEIADNGDRILYFQNRTVIDPLPDGLSRIIALNETKNKVLWVSDSLDDNSNVDAPIVYNKKLYFNGDKSHHVSQ
jgi:hypothetical protein